MPDLFALGAPLLRALPPETAHLLTLRALAAGLGGRAGAVDPPVLRMHLWGRDFPNPIGIAAGFDKDARVPDALLRLGFGFVEIGTVTPLPQPGNPRPRVFRLDADRALINRLGFNSGGLDVVVERLRVRAGRGGIVGVNIGRNRDSADALADYIEGVRRGAAVADYLVVNVSSPNTPGLRDLQARDALEALLRELVAAREATQHQVPLLVKIAPDLGRAGARRHRRGGARLRHRRHHRVEHDRGAAAGSAQSAGARGRRAQRTAAIRAFDRNACATCIG